MLGSVSTTKLFFESGQGDKRGEVRGIDVVVRGNVDEGGAFEIIDEVFVVFEAVGIVFEVIFVVELRSIEEE